MFITLVCNKCPVLAELRTEQFKEPAFLYFIRMPNCSNYNLDPSGVHADSDHVYLEKSEASVVPCKKTSVSIFCNNA